MALLGQTASEYKSSYMSARSGGMAKRQSVDEGKYKARPRKRRKYRQGIDAHNRRADASNKAKNAANQQSYASDFAGREKTDYAGMDLEEKYGSGVADTIMSAHSEGITGNYSRYSTGSEGGIQEHNFGDVAMAAGRIQDRRDIRSTLDEGRYGGGSGRGESKSGGSGTNLFSSAAATRKKKKSNLLGSGEQLGGAGLTGSTLGYM